MIPHTKTARMLMNVVTVTDKSIEGVGRISPQHPAVKNGRAPAFLGIELGAQATAAMHVGPPPSAATKGYLVRIREAVFLQADLPADEDLRVIADIEGSAGPLTKIRIRVFTGDAEAVTALITTHQS